VFKTRIVHLEHVTLLLAVATTIRVGFGAQVITFHRILHSNLQSKLAVAIVVAVALATVIVMVIHTIQS